MVSLASSTESRQTPSQAWVQWRGRWGERQSWQYNGPVGPKRTKRWTDPVGWQERLRSDSISVPGASVLGPAPTDVFCDTTRVGSLALMRFVGQPWYFLGVLALPLALVGGLIGAIAGFFGGWVDAILSRITDIFYAIPMLLGAIVVLQMFRTSTSIWKVVLVLALFGWVSIARIARSAVLEAKNLEFNTASTALGSTPMRNLFRHVIPNSLAPVIVIATTSLGSYIVSEATLSFLGIGLPSSVVSWGGDISTAQSLLRTNPEVLFYPSAALAVTVLAFIMLGDAVKDALDPKSRTA